MILSEQNQIPLLMAIYIVKIALTKYIKQSTGQVEVPVYKAKAGLFERFFDKIIPLGRTEIQSEILRQVRLQIEERFGGSKQRWEEYCRQRAFWWWKNHGLRYLRRD